MGKDTKGKRRPMYIRIYIHMLLVHTFFFFFNIQKKENVEEDYM